MSHATNLSRVLTIENPEAKSLCIQGKRSTSEKIVKNAVIVTFANMWQFCVGLQINNDC